MLSQTHVRMDVGFESRALSQSHHTFDSSFPISQNANSTAQTYNVRMDVRPRAAMVTSPPSRCRITLILKWDERGLSRNSILQASHQVQSHEKAETGHQKLTSPGILCQQWRLIRHISYKGQHISWGSDPLANQGWDTETADEQPLQPAETRLQILNKQSDHPALSGDENYVQSASDTSYEDPVSGGVKIGSFENEYHRWLRRIICVR